VDASSAALTPDPPAQGALVRLGRRLAAPYALDLRSLALCRVGLGAAALGLALARLRNATALYSDAGILTRAAAHKWVNLPGSFALGFLSGSPVFAAALLGLAALSAVGVVLGWHTRACTVVCWALTWAARERNLLAMNGGDDVVVLFLFWGAFLPLGARASLDALRAPSPPRGTIASLATVGFVVQLFCIYFFAALLKNGVSWRVDGSALYRSLALDMFATPLGIWLRQFHGLCRWLTFATFDLEFIGGLLLLSPFFVAPLRTGLVASFVALHVGIGLTLHIPIFCCATIAAWLALTPSYAWERVSVPAWVRARCRALIRFAPRFVPPRKLPSWAQALAAAALVLVLASNTSALPGAQPLSPRVAWLLQATGLAQAWTMFAPNPLLRDGWYVFPATLADGAQVDLDRGGPPTFARPASVAHAYRDSRWRSVLISLAAPDGKPFLPGLARYLCARWNGRHPAAERAVHVAVVFMDEETLPDDPVPPAQKRTLFEGDCAGSASPGRASSP